MNVYKNVIFIACDYLSIMKNGEEGQKTSNFVCIIVMQSIDRLRLFLSGKGQKGAFLRVLVSQFVAANLTSQRINAYQSVPRMCDQRAFFYFTTSLTGIMPDFGREVAVLGYNFCRVCELCYFNTHSALHSSGLEMLIYRAMD